MGRKSKLFLLVDFKFKKSAVMSILVANCSFFFN